MTQQSRHLTLQKDQSLVIDHTKRHSDLKQHYSQMGTSRETHSRCSTPSMGTELQKADTISYSAKNIARAGC